MTVRQRGSEWANDGLFGSRVKELRTRRGLSRRTLAERCDGVPSQSTLFRWEEEGRLPQSDVALRNVVEALDTTAGYLLLGEEDDVD